MRSLSLARQSHHRPTPRGFRLALVSPVVALALLAGCAPGGNLPMIADSPPSAYKLGPGDQVHITTFGDADLSGDFHVSDSGRVDLPLVGGFPAAGMSTTQVAAAITDDLKQRKILNDPHVSVEVTTYRPVFVLGEVKNPGSYPYQPGMTMLTAVAVAGGYTYRAYDKYAEVVRTSLESGTATEARALPQTVILPGDVVRVLERNF